MRFDLIDAYAIKQYEYKNRTFKNIDHEKVNGKKREQINDILIDIEIL